VGSSFTQLTLNGESFREGKRKQWRKDCDIPQVSGEGGEARGPLGGKVTGNGKKGPIGQSGKPCRLDETTNLFGKTVNMLPLMFDVERKKGGGQVRNISSKVWGDGGSEALLGHSARLL